MTHLVNAHDTTTHDVEGSKHADIYIVSKQELVEHQVKLHIDAESATLNISAYVNQIKIFGNSGLKNLKVLAHSDLELTLCCVPENVTVISSDNADLSVDYSIQTATSVFSTITLMGCYNKVKIITSDYAEITLMVVDCIGVLSTGSLGEYTIMPRHETALIGEIIGDSYHCEAGILTVHK